MKNLLIKGIFEQTEESVNLKNRTVEFIASEELKEKY